MRVPKYAYVWIGTVNTVNASFNVCNVSENWENVLFMGDISQSAEFQNNEKKKKKQ